MVLTISLILIGLAFLVALSAEPFAFILLVLGCIGVVYSCHENETPSQDEQNTELIHRYQQGDYSIELRTDGDKVDTLYIFK